MEFFFLAFGSMNIQKYCIKNVEGSRQGKMICLIFTDGYKHPQSQNGLGKTATATTTTETQNKGLH